MIIVDDHSRFTWTIMMKHKYEARQHVMNFVQLIETQHDSKIKIIRSDNGVEFIMPQYYASKGIIHQTTCVETPEQNGRVERKHQHLLNVGRAFLFQAKLPKSLWNYAIQHATYLINRTPTPVLNNKSPFEILHNSLPNLEHLKVFGSLTFASTLTAHRTKLEPRSRKCIFLGYKQGVKGTILFDLANKEIFLSRNVTRYDHILPYTSSNNQPSWHYHTSYTPTTPSTFVDSYTPTYTLPPLNLDSTTITSTNDADIQIDPILHLDNATDTSNEPPSRLVRTFTDQNPQSSTRFF
ncbi:myosin-16 [Trifolium repens]|nr:myosin-16 [Trifolium repens]